MRRPDSQLVFDIDLAKQQTLDNPVYYVQYAHARIRSIFANAAEKGFRVPLFDQADVTRLDTAEELHSSSISRPFRNWWPGRRSPSSRTG